MRKIIQKFLLWVLGKLERKPKVEPKPIVLKEETINKLKKEGSAVQWED